MTKSHYDPLSSFVQSLFSPTVQFPFSSLLEGGENEVGIFVGSNTDPLATTHGKTKANKQKRNNSLSIRKI